MDHYLARSLRFVAEYRLALVVSPAMASGAVVSGLNRDIATRRPKERTPARSAGGLDNRGGSLKTPGTNPQGPERGGLPRDAPAPGLRANKQAPIPKVRR